MNTEKLKKIMEIIGEDVNCEVEFGKKETSDMPDMLDMQNNFIFSAIVGLSMKLGVSPEDFVDKVVLGDDEQRYEQAMYLVKVAKYNQKRKMERASKETDSSIDGLEKMVKDLHDLKTDKKSKK